MDWGRRGEHPLQGVVQGGFHNVFHAWRTVSYADVIVIVGDYFGSGGGTWRVGYSRGCGAGSKVSGH